MRSQLRDVSNSRMSFTSTRKHQDEEYLEALAADKENARRAAQKTIELENKQKKRTNMWTAMIKLTDMVPQCNPKDKSVLEILVCLPSGKRVKNIFSPHHIIDDVLSWSISQHALSFSKDAVLKGDFDSAIELWETNHYQLAAHPMILFTDIEQTLAEAGIQHRSTLRLQEKLSEQTQTMLQSPSPKFNQNNKRLLSTNQISPALQRASAIVRKTSKNSSVGSSDTSSPQKYNKQRSVERVNSESENDDEDDNDAGSEFENNVDPDILSMIMQNSLYLDLESDGENANNNNENELETESEDEILCELSDEELIENENDSITHLDDPMDDGDDINDNQGESENESVASPTAVKDSSLSTSNGFFNTFQKRGVLLSSSDDEEEDEEIIMSHTNNQLRPQRMILSDDEEDDKLQTHISPPSSRKQMIFTSDDEEEEDSNGEDLSMHDEPTPPPSKSVKKPITTSRKQTVFTSSDEEEEEEDDIHDHHRISNAMDDDDNDVEISLGLEQQEEDDDDVEEETEESAFQSRQAALQSKHSSAVKSIIDRNYQNDGFLHSEDELSEDDDDISNDSFIVDDEHSVHSYDSEEEALAKEKKKKKRISSVIFSNDDYQIEVEASDNDSEEDDDNRVSEENSFSSFTSRTSIASIRKSFSQNDTSDDNKNIDVIDLESDDEKENESVRLPLPKLNRLSELQTNLNQLKASLSPVINLDSDSDDDANNYNNDDKYQIVHTTRKIERKQTPGRPPKPAIERDDYDIDELLPGSDDSYLSDPEDEIETVQISPKKPAGNTFASMCGTSESLQNLKHISSSGKIKHLSVKLLKHQIQGVDWMLQREHTQYLSPYEALKTPICPGGVLADDMGLGKTIQTIATTLEHPSPYPWKSTLIVCTLSTVSQWEKEITSKTYPNKHVKICLYYGSNRPTNPAVVASADIVLTTYGIVQSEFSRGGGICTLMDPNDILGNDSDDEDDNGGKKKRKKKQPVRQKKTKETQKAKSVLFQIKWWRVVLDEAHYIKNRTTAKHKAMARLEAYNRWCLTGTPIQNELNDIWSLLHFIRAPNCENIRHFNTLAAEIKSNSKIGFEKLHELINPLLLRREKSLLKQDKESTMSELPNCIIKKRMIDFYHDERTFYTTMFEQAKSDLEKFIAKGTLIRNYMHVFEQILRLRQACNHPYLLAKDSLLLPDINVDDLSMVTLSRMNMQVEVGLQSIRSGAEFKLAPVVDEDDGITQSVEVNANILDSCSICVGELFEPVLTPCKHFFCKECISSWNETSGSTNDMFTCPVCRALISYKQLKKVTVLVNRKRRSTMSSREITECSKPKQVATSRGKQRDYFSLLNEDIVAHIFSYLKNDVNNFFVLNRVCKRFFAVTCQVWGSLLRSSKIDALLEDVNKYQKDGKCVVFSQFTKFLDVVQYSLKSNGIEYVRLDGSMNLSQRKKVIDKFQNEEKTRVFILSLKAAACGLNLTAGKYVFMLDPWWNGAIEQQAIDRVHRYGQKNEVQVFRYVTRDSIEENLLLIQERKLQISSAVLNEPNTNKLSSDDLLSLFTPIRAFHRDGSAI